MEFIIDQYLDDLDKQEYFDPYPEWLWIEQQEFENGNFEM